MTRFFEFAVGRRPLMAWGRIPGLAASQRPSQPRPLKNHVDSPLKPILPKRAGEKFAWSGLAGSGRGLAIASAAEIHRGPLLVIATSSFSAQRLEDEIRFY